MRVNSNIQVFLPQLQDILANEFMGLAKNLAYIVDFHNDSPALASQATGFTINTSSCAHLLSNGTFPDWRAPAWISTSPAHASLSDMPLYNLFRVCSF